jgi:hypothetical protein
LASHKIALAPGQIERDDSDGRRSARYILIGRVRTLYPDAYNEVAKAKRINARFLSAWRMKYPRVADRQLVNDMHTVGLLDRGFREAQARIANGTASDVELVVAASGLPSDSLVSAPHLHSFDSLYPESDGIPPEAGGPMRSAEPTQETRNQYLKIAAKHFDARASRLVTDEGRCRRERATMHFDWLVHYLFGPKRSFGQLALKFGTANMKARSDGGRTTMRKAVHSLATLIGITLPDGADPGRGK